MTKQNAKAFAPGRRGRHYKKAVILSWARSGTQLLATGLAGKMPRRRINRGECFIRRPELPLADFTDAEIVDRYVWRSGYLPSVELVTATLQLYDQRPTLWDALAEVDGLRFVVLRRAPVPRHVSMRVAQEVGSWSCHADNPTPTVRVDLDELREEVVESAADFALAWEHLDPTRAISVRYEDLRDDYLATLSRVCSEIGVGLVTAEPRTIRQITRPLSEVVENWDDVKAAFGREPWFSEG